MNFYVSFLNNIALKIVANNIKYLCQLTGFYPPMSFISTVIIFCCLFSFLCVEAVFKFCYYYYYHYYYYYYYYYYYILSHKMWKNTPHQYKHWDTRTNSAVWPISFPEFVLLLFHWTGVTSGLWERGCGIASTLHMRKTITLMNPIRAKQLSMAAIKRVIWLCACVRYWPYGGVGTCASVLKLVLFQNTFSRA